MFITHRTVPCVPDNLDRIIKVLYNGSDKYAYSYNSDGSLYMAQEFVRGYTYYYNYDGLGRLISYSMYTNGEFTESVEYGYDEYNRANTTTVNGGENSVTATYTYNNDNGTLTKLNNAYDAAGLDRSHGFTYTYDGLMRLTTKKLTHHNASLTSTYGYADNLKNSTYTSSLVDEINYKTNSSSGNIFEFDYSYDRIGNIKSVTSGGSTNYHASGTVNYFYDKMNQLVMEINPHTGKTYLYEYDTYGNIRYRYTIDETGFSSFADAKQNIGAFTFTSDTYTYGNSTWKDQLTAYNGAAFTYDAIGNPTKYNNGKSYTFQWQNGRELYRSSVGGKITYYAYGENGHRTIKNTNGGEKYYYYYAGDQLISQVWDDGAQSLNFLYDESGSIYGFIYDDGSYVIPYFYIKNVQGDVVAIMDEDGSIWATYNYDAWGNILSITDYAGYDATDTPSNIGNINPIRYRGYYYDTETGFYYLQSRYYDPVISRWINADAILDTSNFMGMNLFVYCLNNPIMLVDPFGLCAKAWAAGFQGPCPGQGLPGCMDNWPQFQDSSTVVSAIDPDSPPDHPDYIPPKKGGKTKVKNPNGKGRGWPAKDGGVWVHTPGMHGGEGWTIQYPGGDHSHAYPGGGVRNHFELEQSTGRSIIMIFGGAVTSVYLIANDVTGIGAADDPLLAGSMACFVAGIDGLAGKKVCTVCGEVKYGY